MKKFMLLFAAVCFCAGCGAKEELPPPPVAPAPLFREETDGGLEPFDDARGRNFYKAGDYKESDIITYTFNEETEFEGNGDIKEALLEGAKNPGLSVRALHDMGITGEGVNAAVIGAPLLTNHPEYTGKILAYNMIGMPDDGGASDAIVSGAAAGVLAGETAGVAPGVNLYYVAISGRDKDTSLLTEALDWILSLNADVDDERRKIRVVALAYSLKNWTNVELWNAAREKAQREGVLILEPDGMFWPCYYEPSEPDNINMYTIGLPGRTGVEFKEQPENTLAVPVARRTLADCSGGAFTYVYNGKGDFELSSAYAAGVIALGLQEYFDISNAAALSMLSESAYVSVNQGRYLNPIAFVDMVRKKKEEDDNAKAAAEKAEEEAAAALENETGE